MNMRKEIKFSWVYPKYSQNEINGSHWHLPTLGRKMDGVDDIENIKPKEGSTEKSELPWLQLFEEDIRIGVDNVDWSKWNGVTWADIDSKLYYNNVKQFIPKQLYGALYGHLREKYSNNFLGMQFSNSAKGYHIFFYFDVEKTYENFQKCSMWTKQAVYDTFCAVGASDIITYKKGKSKVLDTCSSSPVQGIYLTAFKLTFGYINNENFGSFDSLAGISLSQAAELTNINNTPLFVNDKPTFEVKDIREVDKSEVKYYSHPYRRSIYEALMTVYRDKETVNTYWNDIANMIPSENNHDTNFYINEPSKNKWFERYNPDKFHSIRILKDFGWNIEFKNSYVFLDDMSKNWRISIKNRVIDIFMHLEHNWKMIEKKGTELYLNDKGNKYEDEEEALKDAIAEFKEKYKYNTIFDVEFDYLQDEDYTLKLQEFRDSYYKQKFNIKDFKYICKYEMNKDSMSYQYFMDIYYRDENNFPIIKYDALEDCTFLYSYDKSSMKTIWHVLKTDDEYVIWHNNDVYSNKMSLELFKKSTEYFSSHNFGYNTLRDYLNSLDTNNIDVEKLETFLIRHLEADDTPLVRKMTRNWYIAAVKKQMEDEIFVFPHMLVLMGETGCGKSFINVAMFTINDKQFWTDNIDVEKDDKDNGPMIRKNWLILWNEGKGLSKKDNEANKKFMDKVNSEFTFQKKFENEITVVKPRAVICYTTNAETIYSDATISMDRRSWLIKCNAAPNSMTEEKRNAILEEKDLIWATALKLYLDNPNQNLELDNVENEILGNMQEEHQMISKNEIDEWYEDIMTRPYQLTLLEGSNVPVFTSFENFTDQLHIEKHEWKTPVADNINCSFVQFDRIPTVYISDLLKQTGKNNNFYLKLKKKFKEEGWTSKAAGYPSCYNIKMTKKCWVKNG